jgi:tetratricopeptide (TPR) repeat protein
MPKALAMEAFDWLAIRGGGSPAPAVVDRYAAAVGARARDLEAAGRLGEALRVWQGLAEDLAGSGGATAAAAEAKRLGPGAAKDLERVRKVTERDRAWITAANQTVLALAQDPPPALPRLRSDFEVDALRKESRSADRVHALSASRRLNAVETNVIYYLPERFKAQGQLVNAIRSYELAAAIDPESPAPPLGLARVYARAGTRKAALDALRTAVARGPRIPRPEIAEDPELAPLASDPAFDEILRGLPAS